MNDRVTQLEQQVATLMSLLGSINSVQSENVTNIVFPDQDKKSATYTAQSIGSGGGTINVPVIPDSYVRVIIKGKTYNVPLISIT